jgi:hypothetical protein
MMEPILPQLKLIPIKDRLSVIFAEKEEEKGSDG